MKKEVSNERSVAGLRVEDKWILFLTLCAPLFGGGTQLWAQALLLLGAGVTLLVAPPRAWPALAWLWVSGVLLTSCAWGFLPASWFTALPFRAEAIQENQIALANSLTMQPWLTLESTIILVSSLAWAGYLLTQNWSTRLPCLVEFYTAGILVLSAAGLACYWMDWRPPFWQPVKSDFGFFPNRNQTANLLALGGVLSLALSFRAFRGGRWGGLRWLAGFIAIGVALVINGSRAGVMLYFLGSLVWVLWAFRDTSKQRYWALALTSVLLLLSAFLLFGGPTLERFTEDPERHAGTGLSRVEIQRDTLVLLREASWHGLGLGNFGPVFAHYRTDGTGQGRCVHPESDWLWGAVELGWPAPLAVLVGVGTLLARAWPKRSQPGFLLRSALTVCVVMFLAHGFVDVSGHRLGSLWPALLLLALLHATRCDSTARPGYPAGPAWVFRGVGFASATMAVVWVADLTLDMGIPTSARAGEAKHRAYLAQAGGSYDRAAFHANEIVRFAPLDWEAYYLRAAAALRSDPNVAPALDDFRRTRFLEPLSPEVPFQEAQLWLVRQPMLAFSGWAETLRRARGRKADYLRRIMGTGCGIPEVEEELFSLVFRDRELLMVFLAFSEPEACMQEIHKLWVEDPKLRSLTGEQRSTVLKLWSEVGDHRLLGEYLRNTPELKESAWLAEAELAAERHDLRAACEGLHAHAPVPTLPIVNREQPLPELRRLFLTSTNDFALAFALYQAEFQEEQFDDAHLTLTRALSWQGCPKYFHFLAAEVEMKRNNWELAWKAWSRFLALR